MNALINISTDEQGSQVVSARELYEFLEVKSKFADWIKNRIIKYGFLEDTDYIAVSKILENGGREIDYALTLDMAKELSMVERNDKGKEARQYFITCEKQLKAVVLAPPTPTTEQVLLQQAYKLVDQQNQINELREVVAQIQQTGTKPTPALPKPRTITGNLRKLIGRRVNDYCGYHGATQQETYQYLYRRMVDVFRIYPYRLTRQAGETVLDAIERYGYLDQLYSLVMAELDYRE